MPNIPASMNLGQLPTAIPSIMFKQPKEGHKSVAYDIDWSRPIAQGLDTIYINMQDGGTLEFSQICGLIVDNSNCGSDLDFIFPDTDVVISVPAYAPYTCLQINTQQVQLYVRALQPLAGDKTDFMVLNYAPMPVAVPITIQQQLAVTSAINITGAGSTVFAPAGLNGTLRSFTLSAAWNTAAGAFNNAIELRDGAGSVLWGGNIAGPIGAQQFSKPLVDLSGLSLRFENGLNIVQTGGFVVGGTIRANGYYITP